MERVLSMVERVPAGRVVTYGDLAEMLGGGPRLVGTVLSRYGAGVPWWRVVRSGGRPATGHEAEAWELLVAEGTPTQRGRVDLARARWSGVPPACPDSDT